MKRLKPFLQKIKKIFIIISITFVATAFFSAMYINALASEYDVDFMYALKLLKNDIKHIIIFIILFLSIFFMVLAPFIIKEEELAKKEPIKTTSNAELDKLINQGKDYILKFKKINIDIKNVQISHYINRIEKLSKEIFKYIKNNSTQISQIRRLLNYYLPTTLKLLESYAEMETLSYKGKNIISSMNNIEKMIQEVLKAFENQLDALYSQKNLYVDADIKVLNSILKQEGLLDDKSDIDFSNEHTKVKIKSCKKTRSKQL